MSRTHAQLQAIHEQRQAEERARFPDPLDWEHDLSGCVCCCWSCGDLEEEVTASSRKGVMNIEEASASRTGRTNER